MPGFPNSVLLNLNLIIGICALAFACNIHAQHTKYYFTTDHKTFVTPCAKTPNNDPSEILAELEESGLNCTEGSECPTCGCFVFLRGEFVPAKTPRSGALTFLMTRGTVRELNTCLAKEYTK